MYTISPVHTCTVHVHVHVYTGAVHLQVHVLYRDLVRVHIILWCSGKVMFAMCSTMSTDHRQNCVTSSTIYSVCLCLCVLCVHGCCRHMGGSLNSRTCTCMPVVSISCLMCWCAVCVWQCVVCFPGGGEEGERVLERINSLEPIIVLTQLNAKVRVRAAALRNVRGYCVVVTSGKNESFWLTY